MLQKEQGSGESESGLSSSGVCRSLFQSAFVSLKSSISQYSTYLCTYIVPSISSTHSLIHKLIQVLSHTYLTLEPQTPFTFFIATREDITRELKRTSCSSNGVEVESNRYVRTKIVLRL